MARPFSTCHYQPDLFMKHLINVLWVLMLMVVLAIPARAQDVSKMANAQPVTISGQFGLGLGTYTSSGIDNREHPFSYLLSGAPVLTLYGISFPFSVVVSDQQRGFRQPFNQYGISPQYKWLTVHAGWQSITWSPFTLSGYNFLGGGIEATPGKLRLGFIYGRFNKAIAESSSEPLLFQTPSYSRSGYAAKLGYGTEQNHVDITFLKAKDNLNSIQNPSILSGLQPAENLVAGIGTKFLIAKHFRWEADVAGSLYTRNRLSDTLRDFDLGGFNFLKNWITLNNSSQLLTAAQTALSYQNNNYNIGIQYKRVDPDFKSMGAYYFETDVANYTVNGGISLLKNQLQLNGSLGFQHDNIAHDLMYTSHRTISSFSASYNTSKFGADFRFSNYGITQDRGLNPVIDTFRVARTNYNVNGLIRYMLGDSLISHNFILSGNLQSLVDLNHFTSGQSQSNSKSANLSYSLGFGKSGLSINSNLNYTVAQISTMHTRLFGPSIGISQQLDKNRLMLNANIAYQQQHNDDKDAGNVINAYLNGSYRLGKRDGITTTISYLKSNSKDATLPSFSELRSSLSLTHTF